MTVSLELRGLARSYVKDNETFYAVDNVNLTVAPGEFLTFLGPSGCGKTTTLRMIAGFETPTGGAILVDGKDMTTVPANEPTPDDRRRWHAWIRVRTMRPCGNRHGLLMQNRKCYAARRLSAVKIRSSCRPQSGP